MSAATDRADRETLDLIGREPGVRRGNGRGQRSWRVNAAASQRLINAGLATVTGRGRLYLTEAGTEIVWADVTAPPAPPACGVRDCDCHTVTA